MFAIFVVTSVCRIVVTSRYRSSSARCAEFSQLIWPSMRAIRIPGFCFVRSANSRPSTPLHAFCFRPLPAASSPTVVALLLVTSLLAEVGPVFLPHAPAPIPCLPPPTSPHCSMPKPCEQNFPAPAHSPANFALPDNDPTPPISSVRCLRPSLRTSQQNASRVAKCLRAARTTPAVSVEPHLAGKTDPRGIVHSLFAFSATCSSSRSRAHPLA